MTEEAWTYLNEALDYIQQHALRREQIDWQTLRQEVCTLAAQAQIPEETYPAIKLALEHLRDRHSSFSSPAERQLVREGKRKQIGLFAFYPEGMITIVAAGSPAEKAGVHVGDRIHTINGQLLATLTKQQFFAALSGEQLDLTFTREDRGQGRIVHLQAAIYPGERLPQGYRLEGNIGYLDLPHQTGSRERAKIYGETVQQLIRAIDQTATCGWIIDLRRNGGGNMWPMIAGIGPVLGEGACVSFVAPQEKEVVFYSNGQAYSEQEGVIAEVEEPYHLKRPDPAVAVLTSPLTASSGEFVVLAIQGLSRARSFGEPTYGVPTATDIKQLRDGAVIHLMTHLGADRKGQVYDSPLIPDYAIKIDWTRLDTPSDPVLQAALQWLQVQGGRS